ncbi:DUF1992 domain-containing protein [Tateyamaria omphalii]|uniref:DnaJ family domain-containing protein n=1 Tax=Tateyamaria omphalii TaxID=299262 RepID=UPI001C99AF38|nr:DUF1992 domain-containing protein [Tateyamaria omphalii]MBY5934842.1 DUF1992 domain-containing protein [Tateyamaria omphalii]
MSRGFRRLIERQIEKARVQGQLSGLEGEGKPLPARPEQAVVDPADAAGFRIMAQAGVVPEEIEIKRAMDAHRAHLATLRDESARKVAMKKLAQLELRYNIAREARKKFLQR